MRDYAYVVVGKAVSAVAQMVMLAALAVRLAPEDIALLLAVYSIASVVAALGDLGLGTLAMRERVYGDRAAADKAIRVADRLAMGAAVTGSGIVVGLASLSPALLVAAPLLIWAPVERATETRTLRSIADGSVVWVAVLNGARRLGALALFLLMSSRLAPDWSFSISLAVSAIAAQIVAAQRVPLADSSGSPSARLLLGQAVPFTFTSISGQMRNLDVPIIASFIGGVAAASYGLGARFASPALLVFSAISSLVLVRVRNFPGRVLRTTLRLSIAVPLIVCAALLGLTPAIQGILVRYVPWMSIDAVLVMVLVMSSYFLAGMGIVLGSICVAFNRQWMLVRVNIATVASSLFLVSWIAAASGSAIWAASASAGCYLGQALILVGICTRASSSSERNVSA